MSRLHRQPAQKICRRTARKKQNRQPQRHHPDHREIREVHVLDHAVAQNVQLRPDRRGHFLLPRQVPIERIQPDRRHGQPHRRQVRPCSSPEQTHCRKTHRHPQKGHFVRRPLQTHLPRASRGPSVESHPHCHSSAR